MHTCRNRYINRWTNQETNVYRQMWPRLCCLQLPSLQMFVQAWLPMPLGRTRGAYIWKWANTKKQWGLWFVVARPALQSRLSLSVSIMWVQRHEFWIEHVCTVITWKITWGYSNVSNRSRNFDSVFCPTLSWIVEPPLFCLTRRTADRPYTCAYSATLYHVLFKVVLQKSPGTI